MIPDFNPEFDQLLDRTLVASKPTFIGLGHMAEAYHSMQKSSSQVHVFYDLPSALNWLELRESEIQLPTPKKL